MTQEELAKKADISRTTLAKIEANESAVVTTVTISKLADALDVPASKIFKFSGN